MNPQVIYQLMSMAAARRGGPQKIEGLPGGPRYLQPPNLPNGVALPKPGMMPVTPQQPMPQPGGPGSLHGPPPQAIAPNLGRFLQNTGMALLAQSDSGGSFWGNLGRALPAGLQGADAFKREQALDDVVGGLPMEYQGVLKALPLAQRAALAAQMIMGGDEGDRYEVVGNNLYDTVNEAWVPLPAGAEGTELSSIANDVLSSFGVNPGTWNPETASQEFLGQYYQRLNEYRTSGRPLTTVSVNQGGPVEKTLDENAQNVFARHASMRDEAATVENLNTALQITQDPKFKEVSGLVGGTVGDVLARAGANPEAAKLAQQYDMLTSEMALEILRNFTGAKSDFEYQVAERMANKDRTLQADQLEVGIRFLIREGRRQALEWAEDVMWYTDNADMYNISDPRKYARERRTAQEILDRYGKSESAEDPDNPAHGFKGR